MKIYICSLSEVALKTEEYGATHVLSLLDPPLRPSLHATTPLQNHLLIHMADVRLSDYHSNSPKEEQVQQILDWAKKLPDDAILLVHCYAGVSRSTAAAMAILVQYYGNSQIDKCIEMVHAVRKQSCPNPIITEIADKILGCNGEFHKKAQDSSPFTELFLLV